MIALLRKTTIAAALSLGAVCAFAQADDVVVEMNLVSAEGIGAGVGTITLMDTEYGLVLAPDMKGLTPGIHGFHVHVNPNCGPEGADGKMGAALAAGGHYDPDNTGKHGTPWGDGHKGDLPALFVDADGNATYPVLAPRLSVDEVKGHAIMVHVGGDNHSDHPAALGGGGARMVCGVAH